MGLIHIFYDYVFKCNGYLNMGFGIKELTNESNIILHDTQKYSRFGQLYYTLLDMEGKSKSTKKTRRVTRLIKMEWEKYVWMIKYMSTNALFLKCACLLHSWVPFLSFL